jgi:LysM repeat protein
MAQTRSSNIQSIDGKKYYIHKIEKSQSVYALSKLYNVSIDELYRINPELRAGAKLNQEIKIPFAPVAAVPAATVNLGSQPAIDTLKYITYRVGKGETVYSLTRKFNLSEKELMNYNPSMSNGVREGQLIVVGEKGRKKGPSKETKDILKIFTAKEKPGSVLLDSSLFRPVSKPKKTSYNVALILPFRLHQTLALDNNELSKTNTNFPPIPALAVDFYLGFKRASDSLRDAGFNVNLQLFDVDDKDTLKLGALVSDKGFTEADLIFGPLYANGFKNISKKAKELYIPIVSPITQQNKILYNNIYISKTNPSQFTLMECLADFCIDSLSAKGANILLVSLNDKDKKEAGFIAAFKKYYNEKQKALGKTLRDTVTHVKGMNGVKAAQKTGMRNVVVSLSSNAVYMTDFITQLAVYAEKKDFMLCGWQTISEMENLDQGYLDQLRFTFPYQYNLTNEQAFRKIDSDYFEMQGTLPGEFYHIGFDNAIYYLRNLKDLGPDFVHHLDQYPAETSYMRFKFARPDYTTGFDNRGVFIFRYKDLQLYNTGWK